MNTLVKDIKKTGIQPLELLQYMDSPRDLVTARGFEADSAVISEAMFVAKQLGMTNQELFKYIGIKPPIAGGSFLTGTSSEVLYSSIATGTQLATFTTEDNLMKTLPNCIIPAGFFYGAQAAGKTLRVKAIGRLGSTATPTFTYTVRLRTNVTWAADGVVMSSAAITVGSGVTLAPWELEMDITARAIGGNPATTATTLTMLGFVRAGTAFAAGGGLYSIPAANTAYTVTLDNTVTQYLYLSAACGTSSASNLIQLEQLKVYGEN